MHFIKEDNINCKSGMHKKMGNMLFLTPELKKDLRSKKWQKLHVQNAIQKSYTTCRVGRGVVHDASMNSSPTNCH
jgi:hypothetical protein